MLCYTCRLTRRSAEPVPAPRTMLCSSVLSQPKLLFQGLRYSRRLCSTTHWKSDAAARLHAARLLRGLPEHAHARHACAAGSRRLARRTTSVKNGSPVATRRRRDNIAISSLSSLSISGQVYSVVPLEFPLPVPALPRPQGHSSTQPTELRSGPTKCG